MPAAKFEYTVTLANGHKTTRKSHRIYTHAVVCNGLRPEVAKRYRFDELKSLEAQEARYAAIVAGNLQGSPSYGLERYPEWLAETRKRIADIKAVIVQGFSEPTDANQGVLGWAGSLALANARARTESKTWAGVRVLPVEARLISSRKAAAEVE